MFHLEKIMFLFTFGISKKGGFVTISLVQVLSYASGVMHHCFTINKHRHLEYWQIFFRESRALMYMTSPSFGKHIT